jgi:hypothetical protein
MKVLIMLSQLGLNGGESSLLKVEGVIKVFLSDARHSVERYE